MPLMGVSPPMHASLCRSRPGIAAVASLLALSLCSCVAAGSPGELMTLLSAKEFSDDSTTPIPISTVSVWMKRLLSHDTSLPQDLLDSVSPGDTVAVAPVRRWLNSKRQTAVEHLCGADGSTCDVNEVDPVYGLTPLHLAAMSGDATLQRWLVERGADTDVMDTAGRKAQNLTFQNFISNSRRWAREAGRVQCDLPTIDFSDAAAGGDVAGVAAEVRRLVREGEPIFMRGALGYLLPGVVEAWDVKAFVKRFERVEVSVGAVPYAGAFDLETLRMSLREYYQKYFVGTGSPLYVFDKAPAVTKEAYDALSRLVREMFPIPEILDDPDQSGGQDGIHFSLGASNSGAPMHLHGDAVNALVHGEKRWFIYTPGRSVYSRTPVMQWLEKEYPKLDDEDKPLECVQRPGDIVYVPLDWGHAVINTKDVTFGYALELNNRRDTYAHLRSRTTGDAHDEL